MSQQTIPSRNPTDLLSDQVRLLSSINQSLGRLEQTQAKTAAELAAVFTGVAEIREKIGSEGKVAPQALGSREWISGAELSSADPSATHLINGIMIVGLIALTFLWIYVGITQIYLGIQLAQIKISVGPAVQPEVPIGIFNIIVSFIHMSLVNCIVKRNVSTFYLIWALSIISAIGGFAQVAGGVGVSIQADSIPIYFLLGWLVTINRGYFTQKKSKK